MWVLTERKTSIIRNLVRNFSFPVKRINYFTTFSEKLEFYIVECGFWLEGKHQLLETFSEKLHQLLETLSETFQTASRTKLYRESDPAAKSQTTEIRYITKSVMRFSLAILKAAEHPNVTNNGIIDWNPLYNWISEAFLPWNNNRQSTRMLWIMELLWAQRN